MLDEVEVVGEIRNVGVGISEQWDGSWDQEPHLTLSGVEDSFVIVSELVQEFLDGWTGLVNSGEIRVSAVNNVGGGLFVWGQHFNRGFFGGFDSGVFDEVSQESFHSEFVGVNHLFVQVWYIVQSEPSHGDLIFSFVLSSSLFGLDVFLVDGEWEEVGFVHTKSGLHFCPVGFGHVHDIVEAFELAVFREFGGFIGNNGGIGWSLGQVQVSFRSVGL